MVALLRNKSVLLLCGARQVVGASHKWYEHTYEQNFVEAIILIALVVLALAFETAWHAFAHHQEHAYHYGDITDHHTKDHPEPRNQHNEITHKRLAMELVHRAGSEFMTLGFLAFLIFIFNNTGGFDALATVFPPTDHTDFHLPKTGDDWLHLFEDVHIRVFVGMVLYFIIMALAVRASIKKMRLWEQAYGEQQKSGSVEQEVTDPTVQSYRFWHTYFVKKILIWQQTRPSVYGVLLEKAGIDPGSRNAKEKLSECFQGFPFSEYLALNVESGVSDSISVSSITWVSVILVFGIFAILHRYAHIELLVLSPIFVALALVVLGLMRYFVSRRKRSIENNYKGPLDSDFEKEVVDDQGFFYAKSRDARKLSGFHQRNHTELLVLRTLQLVIFLITYVIAGTILDFDDWQTNLPTVLTLSIVFIIVLLVIARMMPTAMPVFLGLMALPPFVDERNLAALFKVLSEHVEHVSPTPSGFAGSQGRDNETIKALERRIASLESTGRTSSTSR